MRVVCYLLFPLYQDRETRTYHREHYHRVPYHESGHYIYYVFNMQQYNMDCIRRVALVVNCGYARVCIYHNSNPGRTGQSARQTIDIAKRQSSFKDQFSSTCFPADYFNVKSKNTTQFDRAMNFTKIANRVSL